jgi:hypothetical protein
MLRMSARQIGHPVAMLILMKARNRLLQPVPSGHGF